MEEKNSMIKMIIVYACIAVIFLSAAVAMKKASEFDSRFVHDCEEVGGTAEFNNGMKRCTKDGTMILID